MRIAADKPGSGIHSYFLSRGIVTLWYRCLCAMGTLHTRTSWTCPHCGCETTCSGVITLEGPETAESGVDQQDASSKTREHREESAYEDARPSTDSENARLLGGSGEGRG